ncbi:MAG: hypothetical protein ACFE94_12125 [Candidatus Hodarchaeota archaeon]
MVNYSEGSGGLRVNLRIDYQEEERYSGTLTLHTTSNGDVENIGISYIYYYIYVNSMTSKFNERNLNPPITSFSTNYTFYFDGDDNITVVGNAIAKFNVQGIVQNETINFDVSYFVPLSPSEISYQTEYPLIWLEVLDIVCMIVLIYAIVKIVKSIKHDLLYTEEEKKKDEAFFKYIKEKEREK